MFIGAETRLDVGFDVAQATLAGLARGRLLGRASGGAYDEWQARLARAGSWRTALGMSRLARVRVRDVVTRTDSATWAMRWEVPGCRAALVPALDAAIKLTSDGQDAALLAVSAVCRPPFTGLDTELDPAVVHRVAQATIQALTSQIATAIADSVTPLELGRSEHAAGTWS
jgi:hypothetical protein